MPTKDLKTILFLLNDTDLILLNVIKTKFKKDNGWESVITTSYDDAIQAFEEKEHIDGVLTEVIINDHAGRTGFDFIAEVQSKKNAANAKIIIFTELSLDDDKERAKSLGVKHYYVKSKNWRRGRDSNPRKGYPFNTLAGCSIRPLWHLSVFSVRHLSDQTRQHLSVFSVWYRSDEHLGTSPNLLQVCRD